MLTDSSVSMLYMAPTFGVRLRALREKAGLTPGQLAARVGISENAIRQMELGYTKSASFGVGVRIAEALGITARQLAIGDEPTQTITLPTVGDLFSRVAGLEQRQAASVGAVTEALDAVRETFEHLLRLLEERNTLTADDRAQLQRRLGGSR